MGTLTFSPSLYIGMAHFFLSQHFEFRYFWGFQKKMAILGVGRFKWILCCPLFISFFFLFFGGGGGGVCLMSNLSCFSLFFFCNFKYLFEKVKISLIGGGGGGG